MTILNRLQQFNGKNVSVLQSIVTDLKPEPTDIEMLCAIAEEEDDNLPVGATWVLKQLHDRRKLRFTRDQSRVLLKLLLQANNPWARLHLLQLLAGIEIESRRCQTLLRWLTAAIADEHKLVRAWAFHGFWVLACQHPRYRDQVEELLEAGRNDPVAAVRARIRQLSARDDFWAKCPNSFSKRSR